MINTSNAMNDINEGKQKYDHIYIHLQLYMYSCHTQQYQIMNYNGNG